MRSPKSIFGLPMVDPYSKFALVWLLFIMLMDLVYTAYWVPLNVAFCSTSYGDLSSPCTWADLMGGEAHA